MFVTGISLKVIFYFGFTLWQKENCKTRQDKWFQGPSSAWYCRFVDASVLALLSVSVDLFTCCALCMSLNECPEEMKSQSASYQAEIYKPAKQHTNLSATLDCKTAKWICLRKPSLSTECRAGCTEINLHPVAMATYFKPSMTSGFWYNLEINNRFWIWPFCLIFLSE